MHNPPVILIADDSPDFRAILGEKLKASGFLVTEAKDGAEAVTRAKRLVPDLVIMDIQMPNENGTEAVLDIKQNPETKDVKIVFFTNMENPWPGIKAKNPAIAKELGAAGFIRKTDDLDEMVKKIKEFLGMPA
jgi:CheY-like chemotaxis protein